MLFLNSIHYTQYVARFYHGSLLVSIQRWMFFIPTMVKQIIVWSMFARQSHTLPDVAVVFVQRPWLRRRRHLACIFISIYHLFMEHPHKPSVTYICIGSHAKYIGGNNM